MRPIHRTLQIAVALLLACTPACAARRDNAATPPPLATPTEAQATRAAPRTWAPLAGAQDLADDPSWARVGTPVDGAIAFEAGGDYRTEINTEGPVLAFEGDFGVAATLEVARGAWGAFVLYGALPEGAWWQGMRRLDLEWRQGTLSVVYWDGTQDSPRDTHTFGAPSSSSRATIGLRREGAQLLLLVDGAQVGQFDDPGMFPSSQAYLGVNVPPNGLLRLHGILVEAPTGKESSVEIRATTDAGAYSPSSPSLRELAAARGIDIGAAVAAGPLRGDPNYAAALAHEFSALTAENALKFGPVHPERERYTFGDGDAIVAFGREHDMTVRGHVLVWHQQLPAWVEQGEWSDDALRTVLHDHIATLVGRYRGSIHVWDVVNEAVTDAGAMRNTLWLRTIGPEYIDLAFQWAHEADPDALLFYNDYGAEGLNRKSDAVYDLVKGMLARGVPVHGVGMQFHVAATTRLRAEDLAENVRRLGELGLQVHITELDVRIPIPPTETRLKAQAGVYRMLMETCLAADNCTAFITWGFTDRYSWIPRHNPGSGAALLLDEAYQPKPAYDALRDALTAP